MLRLESLQLLQRRALEVVAQQPSILADCPHGRTRLDRSTFLQAQAQAQGTGTLIEKCSGAVGFEAVATEHRWVVHISGGSLGRGDLTPDREAVGQLGSPFGRAEQMPSRPEVRGDAAEGGQEPLRMPRRFEAFHRQFALSGRLMRVLGAASSSC